VTINRKKLDRIIEQYIDLPGQVLSTLEAIQEDDGYLSKETLRYVSEKMGIPFSQIYSVGTFLCRVQPETKGKAYYYPVFGDQLSCTRWASVAFRTF